MLGILVAFCIQNRVIVVALVVLLIVGGIGIIRTIPIDVYPDINDPRVTILTEAPGMAPEEVEQLVTFPMESQFNGAPFVKRVRSQSGIGQSVIFVEFEWGTDIRLARQMVSEGLSVSLGALPEGVEPFMGPITSQMGEIVEYVVSDDHGRYSAMDTRDYAEWMITYRLQTVPGAAQVVTIGGLLRQFQVLVNPIKLQKYDIALADVVETLEQGNQNAAGGLLFARYLEFLVRGIGRVETIEDVRSLVIESREGGVPITVGDLAEVREGAALRRGVGTYNGSEAVRGKVIKQPNENTIALTRRLLTAFDELNGALPDGMSIVPVYRQADLIQRSVDNVRTALVEGGALVIFIIFIFLFKPKQPWSSFKVAAIPLIDIPLALIVALLFLKVAGFTVNIMTLGGLAIAIGMVVDDGIIDVENTNRRLVEWFKMRADGVEGIETESWRVNLRGTMEIRNSIMVATVIIVLVFVPLLTLGGLEGRIFAPLGWTVIIAMIASFMVSMMVTPAMCQMMLTTGTRHEEEDNAIMVAVKRVYRPVTEWLVGLPSKWPVLALALTAILGSTYYLAFHTGKEFLPIMDEGAMTINALLKPGTSLEQTSRFAMLYEKALLTRMPDLVTVTGTRTGRAEKDEHAEGSYYNETLVGVIPPEKRHDTAYVRELVEEKRRLFPDSDIPDPWDVPQWEVSVIEELSSHLSDYDIDLGDDLYTLHDRVSELNAQLRSAYPDREFPADPTTLFGVNDWAVGITNALPGVELPLPPRDITDYGREEVEKLAYEVLGEFPGAMTMTVGRPVGHRLDHMLSGVTAQLAIKLFGPEMTVLKAKAAEVFDIVRSTDGAVGAALEPQLPIPQILIRINHLEAARLGLKTGDITELIETAFNGTVVGEVLRGERRYELLVWTEASVRRDVSSVSNYPIRTPDGQWVPLKRVADIREDVGPNTINRENAQRRMVVQSNVEGRDLGGFVAELQQQIDDRVNLPKGYYLTFGGQFESQQASFKLLTVESVIVVFVIILLLYVTFQSGWMALMVFLNLLLSLAGGAVSVWAFGGTMSVPSYVGFILLLGIAVRNGIILVSHINDLRAEGMDLEAAILKGAEERVSPVLMTALSTGLGMVPLALATGSGAEIQQPLAVVIVGGMATSTLLTLLVIPALYHGLETDPMIKPLLIAAFVLFVIVPTVAVLSAIAGGFLFT